jgi:hypothetical protein
MIDLWEAGNEMRENPKQYYALTTNELIAKSDMNPKPITITLKLGNK